MKDIFLVVILLVGLLLLNSEWFSNPFFSERDDRSTDASLPPGRAPEDRRA